MKKLLTNSANEKVKKSKNSKLEKTASDKVSKSWTLTHNNYTEKDLQMYRDWDKNYMILGLENAEKTPHIQGGFIFKRGYRFTQLTKLSPKAHWEIAKACDFMNYCTKDQKYEIQDNRSPQGTRTDLITVSKLAKEGKYANILEEYPGLWFRYENSLRRVSEVINRNITPRNFDPKVIWICGGTGIGKTKRVFDSHDITDICSINTKNLNFWNGYDNQPVILFDDVRRDTFIFEDLLKILDRYPYCVNVKNGTRQFNSEYIYITCPYTPRELFINTREDIKQLERRIDIIYMQVFDSLLSDGSIVKALTNAIGGTEKYENRTKEEQQSFACHNANRIKRLSSIKDNKLKENIPDVLPDKTLDLSSQSKIENKM